MAAKTPLALVQEKFGDKNKLVDALEKLTGEELWVSRTNENKGLAHVSNAKLLRLHAIFTEVKAKFGTREKLIEAILELEKRGKDGGLRQKLSVWPVPRLFDAYRSAAKRNAPPSATEKKAKPKDQDVNPAAANAKPKAKDGKYAATARRQKVAAAKPPRSTAKKKPSR
jgi:hypothetical protein